MTIASLIINLQILVPMFSHSEQLSIFPILNGFIKYNINDGIAAKAQKDFKI